MIKHIYNSGVNMKMLPETAGLDMDTVMCLQTNPDLS